MDLNLNGKTALVTASSGGISLEIARALAAEGAKVVINDLKQASVEQAMAEIRHDLPHAEMIPLVGDNGTVAGCNHSISQVPEVDILVNNLGIYEAVGFFEETDKAWQHMFEINIMSGVRLARHYLQGMVGRGHGRIVFISNRASLRLPKWHTTAQRKPCS